MRLSTTKFVLLLVLVVCFASNKVLAKHHKHDHDCDHDDDEDEDWDEEDRDEEDWKDEEWEDENWKDENWKDENNNNRWGDDRDGNWNGSSNWDNDHNRQDWGTGRQPSGSIVAGGSTIWSGSGWPMPTNSYGQPPYPTQATPGAVTATWTQVIPTGNPTNIKSEPQVGSVASNVKSMGVPLLLVAIGFSMLIAA
ncbi:unnamed protein product [Mucor hiemalis]